MYTAQKRCFSESWLSEMWQHGNHRNRFGKCLKWLLTFLTLLPHRPSSLPVFSVGVEAPALFSLSTINFLVQILGIPSCFSPYPLFLGTWAFLFQTSSLFFSSSLNMLAVLQVYFFFFPAYCSLAFIRPVVYSSSLYFKWELPSCIFCYGMTHHLILSAFISFWSSMLLLTADLARNRSGTL